MTGKLRLMLVHAHPDDEASKSAATAAQYSAEGHEVMVVTCTGGERGSILNPAMEKPGVLENMTEIRREEMTKAAEILGIQHRWLGFIDSGLPEGDPLPPLPPGCFALEPLENAARALVAIMREFRPHVVVTYDENGGYPHPDHIRCHEVSVAAFNAASDPNQCPETGPAWQPLKLYYSHGASRSKMQTLHDALLERGLKSPYTKWLAEWDTHEFDPIERVTTRIECAKYFDVRDDALRAHATQIDPRSNWFLIPLDLEREIWPTEEYELVRSFVATTIPEEDLFAGITSNVT